MKQLLRITQNKLKEYCSSRLVLQLTGFIIGLASIIHFFEYFIFIGFIPLIIYVKRIHRYTIRQVLLDFYICGLILCGFSYLFIFQVLPNNWAISLPTWIAVTASLISWLLISCLSACLFILLGGLLYKIKNSNYRLLLLIPIWIGVEIIRSYGIALYSYGPGSSISPNFNFGSIGVIASGTHAIYLSRYVGFYGMSITVLLVNLSLYYLFFKRKITALYVIVIILFFTYFSWISKDNSIDNSTDIVAVHLNEESVLDVWSGWKSLPNEIEILIFPEYSGVLENKDFIKIASKLSDEGVGITSTTKRIDNKTYNQIVYFDNLGNILQTQNKSFIIPSGETMPYFLSGIFKIIGQDDLVEQFQINQQITPGTANESPFKYKGNSFGSLICSGIIALNEYSRLSDEGSNILINTASLSFLVHDSYYHVHARNMARYHAVSNNVPLVQASRSGESFMVLSNGSFINLFNSNSDKIIKF